MRRHIPKLSPYERAIVKYCVSCEEEEEVQLPVWLVENEHGFTELITRRMHNLNDKEEENLCVALDKIHTLTTREKLDGIREGRSISIPISNRTNLIYDMRKGDLCLEKGDAYMRFPQSWDCIPKENLIEIIRLSRWTIA